ncbi:CRISPR-associated endonuclease Cas3'' [Methylobacterium sp. WL30]|uniref:CRISPR-associated endonuclease Cas3'' n=1 Tax=unclassified Methylobacterium TaxID=2615210 RepID=UPI0011CB1F29|nr:MULTISPECIES: CRISPR-associated endonuclease Cas3'' [unclassified Methylobacterium]TXN40543.1 CRISPR-associated endonuclease Cas3'' [Methylobacterium sp. WL93]TXN49648.1 CRISPR-associated endonuclease Cas3'' [Methylobacterium sp. WL119]TXN66144.1 CRISPR-associated endonuclease Cas3'' [Methylobacterium sp. WL30]
MGPVFAHSRPGEPTEAWEPLAAHLAVVADRAACFASAFGWAEAARVAGLLHDIGKVSPEVQAYLRGLGPSRDHSTAGARVAAETFGCGLGRLIATIVAGHHAGLGDGADLDRRLDRTLTPLPSYASWERHATALPTLAALRPSRRFVETTAPGFSRAFLTRMLFSCLVDADFLETERFYARGKTVARGGHPDLVALRGRLAAHMARIRAGAEATTVNTVRAAVLDYALSRAALAPGLFTFTVPTGGGKTLASLAFALEHAAQHGLRRVIHVAPFTAIIEQTAAVFRDALGADAGVLEHHASFDWEAPADRARDGGWGTDPVSRLRRAAENWDAPVVVTTAVQFFESLFADRTARCRKLHNIAGSIVVLDEAQAMPLRLLRPCMAAIAELAANYGASIVLCTATQPALRRIDGFENGLPIDADRELAPNPPRLYAALRRVSVERLPEPVADETIARRFGKAERMLCIVNSRAHARALFDRMREMPGAMHLSTLMCPRHRRMVLNDARTRLRADAPTRIVSTSLIEAGVDIDLPEVWRAATGLDVLAQAAGRCNREGRLALGRVVVFEPAETPVPRDLRLPWGAADPILCATDDPLSAEAMRSYFSELYWRRGPEAFDAGHLDGSVWPILPHIEERAGNGAFPFASIAKTFRFIEETMEPVIVPWQANPADDEAETLLRSIAAMEKPLGADLRRLQAYTVPIPPRLRLAWLGQGVLRPVHTRLGASLLRLNDLKRYDPCAGLRLEEASERSPSDNIIG